MSTAFHWATAAVTIKFKVMVYGLGDSSIKEENEGYRQLQWMSNHI